MNGDPELREVSQLRRAEARALTPPPEDDDGWRAIAELQAELLERYAAEVFRLRRERR